MALALAEGTSVVTESIFENRFKYVDELTRMGARITVESNVAVITGVDYFMGSHVSSPDLRAGAALVLAGLAADGYTVVDEIGLIHRGYEDYHIKLAGLGASIEQVEDEFMPLVEEMNFTDFPAEMIYSGMLESGVPMTFEEFAAQYTPAAAAGGYSADEAGYKAYLKDWVAANPAVQANIDEFNAAIDAGAYGDFPLEMCFTDQWFGFAALSLDAFVAAGGVAEIPAFDPNLAPD